MASKPERDSNLQNDTDTKSFEDLYTKVKDLVPEAVGSGTWYLIIVCVLGPKCISLWIRPYPGSVHLLDFYLA